MLAGELASAQTHGRQALGALGAELAEARAVLGQSVGDRAAEARENLAAARADAAQRFDALAAGVEDVRQDAARAGARTHAALEHAADERRAELEKLNLALSAQVETVRDGLARVETGTQTAFEQAAEALNQSRSAFGAELGELRGALDRRIDVCTADARDNLAAAQAAATQRLDALGASVAATRQDMAQAESHTQAGLEHAGSGLKELRDALDRRVGACAAEAGEKIAAAQAASAQLAHALDGRVEDMRKDATQAETRAQAALERAALTHDAALAKLHDSLDRRIDETAAQTGKALAAAQANASERVDAVAARVEDVCKNLAQSEARTQAALECSTVERRVELGALSETLAARVESVRQGVAQSEANTRIALERAAAEQGGALGKLREELGQRIGASAAAQAVAAKRADTLAAHLDDTRQGVARIEAGAKGAAAHAGAAQAASARQLAALAARVEDLAQAEPRLRTAFECAGAEHRAEFLELRKSAAAQSETASQAQAQAEDRAQTALERAAIEQRGELGKLSLALSTRVESVRDGLAEAEVRTQAALEQASAAHDAALSALRQEFGQSTHAYAAERATLGAAQAASAHRIEKLAARAEDLAQAEMRTQAALEQAAAEHGAEMGALRAALTKDVGQSLEAIEARTQAALAGAAAEQSGALQLVDALAARVDDAAQVERHAAARHAELTELHAALVQTSRTARVSAKKNRHQLAAAMTELRAEQAGAAARLQGDMDRLSAQISAQIRIADDSAIPARLDGLHSRLDARDTQTEAIAASLEQRFAGLERRQAEALEAMHAGLAQIFNETEARFGTLERALAEPGANEDGYDSQRIAVEFETLRQRIEDRILEVEKRSVRALEGVGETIALIAKKFNQPARPDDETDAPAAERA